MTTEKKDVSTPKEAPKATPKEAPKAAPKDMTTSTDDVLMLPVSKINIEKDANPRLTFDPVKLNAMAATLKHVGILNPLTVRLKDGKYYLVGGERRIKACKIAGIKEVPVCVKEFSDGQAAYARFVENAHQEGLNPVERARSIAIMIGQEIELPPTKKGRQPQVVKVNAKIAAELTNMSQSAVSQYLALLDLPKEILEAVRQDKVSFAQARVICGAKNHDDQMKLYKKILKGEAKRASDVRDAAEKGRAKKAVDDSGKKRGRPPKSDDTVPNIRYGLDNALEKLRQARVATRKNTEVREGLATAYERHERAKSDDKKTYYKGVIAAIEWMSSFRDNF